LLIDVSLYIVINAIFIDFVIFIDLVILSDLVDLADLIDLDIVLNASGFLRFLFKYILLNIVSK
jgi:hypothetical protein